MKPKEESQQNKHVGKDLPGRRNRNHQELHQKVEKGAGPDSSSLVSCGWNVCYRAECYNSKWRREVISVRWQDRRSQPLSLPQKHRLGHHLQTKIPLRELWGSAEGTGTPVDHKNPKKSHIEKSKKSSFTLYHPSLRPTKLRTRRDSPSPRPLPWEKEQVKVQLFGLWGQCQKALLILAQQNTENIGMVVSSRSS